jgi:TatD family-associated radical SAM protein
MFCMRQIVYKVGKNLYINLTNRCSNRCSFCLRENEDGYRGYDLWLDREPSVQEVIEAVGDPRKYKEIVFCGYGEPMMRLDELLAISRALKSEGARIRINTNGQANLIHGRNVVPELAGLIDAVSISLNAPDARRYAEICDPEFGEQSFDAILEFAAECKKYIPNVTLTVVNVLSPVDIERCKAIADKLGVGFRVREYER